MRHPEGLFGAIDLGLGEGILSGDIGSGGGIEAGLI